ncbi:MAG: hypothetical protein Q9182_004356 [Xanthomendoza sp. 2 TL-2023]
MPAGGEDLITDSGFSQRESVREIQRQHAKKVRAEQWKRLRWNIRHRMAQELKDMIIVEYLHLLLLPGKIFPQQLPDRCHFEHFSRRYIRANPNALLVTNPRTIMSYRTMYWSQNTWVIGPGPFERTVGFLTRMPSHALRLIKSVEINFTIRDIEDMLWASYGVKVERVLNEIFPSDDDRQLSEIPLTAISNYLLGLWEAKFAIFTVLKLDQLTLDFTDTVMPDGKYCGADLAHNLETFVHQFPKQLNIWAPDGTTRDEIYDTIRDRNGHLLENEPW